jgi:anti-anti-sigma regulatory factor
MIIKDGVNLIVDPPQELTMRTVKDFHEDIKDSFTECEGVFINLIGVIEIDTSGFQMLVSLKNEMKNLNKGFTIVGMSTEVDEIISLYGAGPFFQQ